MPRREISDRETSDIRTLVKFVEIFCQQNHNGSREPFTFKLLDLTEIEKREVLLCPDCTRLLTYGLTMRLRCPHDPKPMCKKCKTNATERLQGRYSGDHEILRQGYDQRGRLDMLYHYLCQPQERKEDFTKRRCRWLREIQQDMLIGDVLKKIRTL
jgi:hypothetical protein